MPINKILHIQQNVHRSHQGCAYNEIVPHLFNRTENITRKFDIVEAKLGNLTHDFISLADYTFSWTVDLPLLLNAISNEIHDYLVCIALRKLSHCWHAQCEVADALIVKGKDFYS